MSLSSLLKSRELRSAFKLDRLLPVTTTFFRPIEPLLVVWESNAGRGCSKLPLLSGSSLSPCKFFGEAKVGLER